MDKLYKVHICRGKTFSLMDDRLKKQIDNSYFHRILPQAQARLTDDISFLPTQECDWMTYLAVELQSQ